MSTLRADIYKCFNMGRQLGIEYAICPVDSGNALYIRTYRRLCDREAFKNKDGSTDVDAGIVSIAHEWYDSIIIHNLGEYFCQGISPDYFSVVIKGITGYLFDGIARKVLLYAAISIQNFYANKGAHDTAKMWLDRQIATNAWSENLWVLYDLYKLINSDNNQKELIVNHVLTKLSEKYPHAKRKTRRKRR